MGLIICPEVIVSWMHFHRGAAIGAEFDCGYPWDSDFLAGDQCSNTEVDLRVFSGSRDSMHLSWCHLSLDAFFQREGFRVQSTNHVHLLIVGSSGLWLNSAWATAQGIPNQKDPRTISRLITQALEVDVMW